jgi:hypothetical protein
MLSLCLAFGKDSTICIGLQQLLVGLLACIIAVSACQLVMLVSAARWFVIGRCAPLRVLQVMHAMIK